jgi:type VI secretion system (T6SS) phospholipase Tle1-like effector
VWFRGVHSDVGGSYKESTIGLAKIALEWMLVQLTGSQLKLRIQINRKQAEIMLGKGQLSPPMAGLPKFLSA